jgi:hypothetical protein
MLSLFSDWYEFSGMDIMGLLTSVKVCQEVPASMDLYLQAVQE